MIKEVNIFQIFPRFILDDKDGFAMCKALEAGLNYFLDKCNDEIDLVMNVDTMPEWRLDEMAWELNCMYDYGADPDVKRDWIKNAYRSYRIHGTAEGVRQYLKYYFGESSISEFWEFGGDPGEFNVAVTGQHTDENEAWIRKAVAKAKNVRSELHNIIYNGGESTAEIYTGAAVAGRSILIASKMY